MTGRHDEKVMGPPVLSGYNLDVGGHKFELSERTLEMLKVAFCAMLAAWFTGCIMLVVYSRDIAAFLVERVQ